MLLREWIQREGSGALTRLQRITGLAYTTIFRAARGVKSVRSDTAQKISDATGGAVSVGEICERRGGETAADHVPSTAPPSAA